MKAEYDFRGAKRGPIMPVPRGKTAVLLHLDGRVLDWFREQVHARGGGDYSDLINDVLRNHVAARRPAEGRGTKKKKVA
jgi:uncharacterized protein (DUF4415 family)